MRTIFSCASTLLNDGGRGGLLTKECTMWKHHFRSHGCRKSDENNINSCFMLFSGSQAVGAQKPLFAMSLHHRAENRGPRAGLLQKRFGASGPNFGACLNFALHGRPSGARQALNPVLIGRPEELSEC